MSHERSTAVRQELHRRHFPWLRRPSAPSSDTKHSEERHTKPKPKVAVIGAGVIGLTNAILAQEAGYAVKIYTDLPTEQTTSMVAGATFAPYSVPLTDKVLEMTEIGWNYFGKLAETPEQTGVRRTYYWEASNEPIDRKTKPYLERMGKVEEYSDPKQIPGEYAHGLKYESFMIDTPIYLQYLQDRFRENGGLIVHRKFQNLNELSKLDAEVVFNCTGLGARELAQDENMTAIKGQLAIIGYRPELAEPVKHDGFYAFPRAGSRRTVLGGTTVENFDPHVEPGVTQTIINANKRIIPDLKEADIIGTIVGLRPYRRGGVRVEAQEVKGKLIIHNYGHGGGGVTLSWGSGRLALDQIKRQAA
ncbi:MAG: FAD-binding oxidoreductase [Patescibacteria group bacterium]|nr:FAD-binding oxidoreductase [Patescibacteria group bacterium]MDE2588320.1 FAD-binding oxidoreductase [Patescibacteria group bacterium]